MQTCDNGQFNIIDDLLREAAQNKASDLHITVGIQPAFRINGKLVFSNHSKKYSILYPSAGALPADLLL